MSGIPEKRQSIRPPRRMLLVVCLILVAMAAVWFAVTTAVQAGGEDCPAERESGAVSNQCR